MNENRLLSLSSVKVHFGGLAALDVDGIDIGSRNGVSAFFIGPNGAGKTTLLNAITGYVSMKGKIALHIETDRARNLSRLSRSEIVRAGVARTFQSPAIFSSITVRDCMRLSNVFCSQNGLGKLKGLATLKHRANTYIETLIDLLGLSLFADKALGELEYHLLRRAEIGRSLAGQPRLLLLDEPTAGLAQEEKDHLSALLNFGIPDFVREQHLAGRHRWASISVGIVTHDIDFAGVICRGAANLPTIHVMNHGKTLVSGSFDWIMTHPAVKEIYLGEACCHA